ncbi:MAG: hypothetical protein ACKOJF_27340, partial [Planctomycetaceae bacterium]
GKLQYVDPSDLYAALLDGVVTDGVRWVDVGGGQTVLPWNGPWAQSARSDSGTCAPKGNSTRQPAVTQAVPIRPHRS